MMCVPSLKLILILSAIIGRCMFDWSPSTIQRAALVASEVVSGNPPMSEFTESAIL